MEFRRIFAGAAAVALALAIFLLWPASSPWQPVTVPMPDDCQSARCEHVEDIQLAHGGTISFYRAADAENVDDEITQWDKCLESALQCFEGIDEVESGDLQRCVTRSSCPEACRAAFEKANRGAGDLLEEVASFESVFLTEGGACVPGDP